MGIKNYLKKEWNEMKNTTGDLKADVYTENGEKINTKGKPKVMIQIVNGKETVGIREKNPLLHLVQLKSGEARLRIDGKERDKEFYFYGYERTENIKKSMVNTAGWTFMGGFFGKAGAMAGGLGSQAGQDKSTAALFLVDKHTNEKITLIIRCDSRVLGKLSLFIPAEKEEEIQEPVADKYEQLEKIATLKEKGILSEEEFQAEKQKLLG